MSAAERNIQLARNLPIRLQRFFALNPPQKLTAAPVSDATSSDTANLTSSYRRPPKLNPFLPNKHPETGRWHPPIYSLRRQAELVKLAKANGVEELLPYTPKSTEARQRKREEQGSRIQGTGLGRKVKGHKWERNLKDKLERRRQAMLDMPRMIQEWKQVRSKHNLLVKSVLRSI